MKISKAGKSIIIAKLLSIFCRQSLSTGKYKVKHTWGVAPSLYLFIPFCHMKLVESTSVEHTSLKRISGTQKVGA